MLAKIGPTLDTTYMLQLRNPHDGQFYFDSSAEYTDPQDCHEAVKVIYGGAFADPSMYRVIEIQRRVLD